MNHNVSRKDKNREMIKSILLAVVIAFSFRSLCFEPFTIPSGSMRPTLLEGDYVFVSKYVYGYSRYSFPFAPPVIKGRVPDKAPTRGDIVVFRLPTDPDINYIKRLVGLPGDHIQVKAGVLYINDKPLPRKRMDDFIDTDAYGDPVSVKQYIETMPNGVSYRVLDSDEHGDLDNTDVFVVPAHHYFFMGDNRDNSQDSRVLAYVGYVPEENLLGPARIIFFSSTAKIWRIWEWFTHFRGDRFFQLTGYTTEK